MVTTKNTIQDGLLVIFCAALFISFGALFVSVLSLPTVQVSNSTGACVSVLPEGSCDQLPRKYVREWVK